MTKRFTAGATFISGFMIVWVATLLLSLALTGAAIFVAWHFIAKFW